MTVNLYFPLPAFLPLLFSVIVLVPGLFSLIPSILNLGQYTLSLASSVKALFLICAAQYLSLVVVLFCHSCMGRDIPLRGLGIQGWGLLVLLWNDSTRVVSEFIQKVVVVCIWICIFVSVIYYSPLGFLELPQLATCYWSGAWKIWWFDRILLLTIEYFISFSVTVFNAEYHLIYLYLYT